MKGRIFISYVMVLVAVTSLAQEYEFEKPFGNSTDWEVAPVWYGDEHKDSIVFVSNKQSTGAFDYTDPDGQKLANVHIIGRKANGKWGNPELFAPELRTNTHDGPVAFAQNSKMLCIVRQYGYNTPGFERSDNGGLFFAYKKGDTWSGLEPFRYNREEFNFFSPFLTSGGDTLFFAAENMPGSYGGFDIYMSRLSDGAWTEPENLGPGINTPGWDCYPFLHASGYLYFSSEGHGASRKDIFYSRKYEGTWLPAVSLPIKGINDRYDQYAFIISSDFNKGFYTRKANAGVQSDIWSFRYPIDTMLRAEKIKKNRFCFRLRENSLDTIDYTVFDYEWVINDTEKIPGHDIKYCFPGPGEYQLDFNVTNKLTDTTMYGVASIFLPIELISQAVITVAGGGSLPDTITANREIVFSAEETNLPDVDIAGYIWDFGDGTKMTGETVRKTFPFPGSEKQEIRLTVLERIDNNNNEPYKTYVEEVVVIPEN